ncbi:hypothetical protein Tco_1569839 [Tanacetum coccineum]
MSSCKLGYNVMTRLVVLLIGLGGLNFFEFVHDPQHVCSRHHLPLSVIMRSQSMRQRRNLVTRILGVLCLRRLHEVIGLPERLASQVFLEWSVPWWLPVLESCQIYMLVEKKYPLAPLTLSMMLEKKLIIDYETGVSTAQRLQRKYAKCLLLLVHNCSAEVNAASENMLEVTTASEYQVNAAS